MISNKTYAIFGLGRYGSAVAIELVNNGADVIAVDSREEIVNSLALEIPVCKCANVTDPEVIKQLGISNVDVVIISMASNLEASVMATMLCKEIGVETVIAKCSNEMHRKILYRVGADKVVFPENESGTRLAKNLLSSGFVDIAELSENVSVLELEIKDDWIGKSLIELDLRRKYSINVMAIRQNDTLNIDLDPKAPLAEGTTLVVLANTKKLSKLK